MSRSREEAEKAGIQVNDIQHNMKRRFPCHNYSDKGTYMLTLVVEGRKPLFGTLQGDSLAPTGSENEPRDYHMQHKTISREQCLMLNRLAEEIVNTPYFTF
jgi:hypothetical protein